MTEDISIVPPPPRVVTRHVSRRIWLEPRVRFWWLAAAALFIIGAGFVISALHARSHQLWLIHDGVHVDAMITATGTETLKNRPQSPDSVVTLEFPWQGSTFSPRPRPLEGRKDFVLIGHVLPLHVNPKDPNDWTWLDEPLPLLSQVIGGIVALPLAAFALLWAVQRRTRIAAVWRAGNAVEAIVLEARITAVAPLSRAVRVTPEDDDDNRIYTVFVPPRCANLQRGDVLQILRPASGATSIAVAWFE